MTIGVLAERVFQHTQRVDEAFDRGTARMDRDKAEQVKALADLRLEVKGDVEKISKALEAVRAEMSALTDLRSKAQGWLAGILFVVALFGGGVGALIKSVITQSGE